MNKEGRGEMMKGWAGRGGADKDSREKRDPGGKAEVILWGVKMVERRQKS